MDDKFCIRCLQPGHRSHQCKQPTGIFTSLLSK